MQKHNPPQLVSIGTSHKTATVAIRERLALVGASRTALVAELLQYPDVHEIVTVSTCNRTEVYAVTSNVEVAAGALIEALSRRAEMAPATLATALAMRSGEEVTRHLFSVAAGIDSAVLGEDQIQGQVRQALALAQEDRSAGALLNHLFQQAISVGKRARTETGINRGKASIGTVASSMVQRQLDGLDGAQVLIVGAGQMSSLVARCMYDAGARSVFVANRHQARAQALAEQVEGSAVTFERINEYLVSADVVIASTSAPHLLLTEQRIREVMQQRGGRPLAIIDLAVPRDVEASVREVPGCHLFDLDDLEQVTARTGDDRNAEVDAVNAIVDEEVAAFQMWAAQRGTGEQIVEMRSVAERIREEEFARFAEAMAHLGEPDRERVEQLTVSLVNKLLHEPMTQIRSGAEPESFVPDRVRAGVNSMLAEML